MQSIESLKSYSQAGQDAFVARVLQYRKQGVFVDIGAGEPETISNTVGLERQFGWSGILCDIETEPRLRAERPGNAIFGDAFGVDWSAEIAKVARGGRIDYLSLDLEPPQLTLDALMLIPLQDIRYSVITIEHDAYRANPCIRLAMRGILFGFGYQIVVPDACVVCNGRALPFEDWWVDPQAVDVGNALAVARDMMSK